MLRQVLILLAVAATISPLGNTGLADTVLDCSGNDNHAESHGDIGNVGSSTLALTFDGDGDYLATPGFSDPMNAATIACWVKFNEEGDTGWDNTMFGNPNWKSGSIRTEIRDGNRLHSVMSANSGARHDVGLDNFTNKTGNWYHVALSFGAASETPGNNLITLVLTEKNGTSGSVFREYADTETFDLSAFEFAGIHIEGRYLNGEMTDMRVYGEGLSNGDIALLADLDPNTNPSATNLLAHYHPTLAPVPEPGTIVLLMSTLLCAVISRRRIRVT
ncbi:MAG: LamG-like jellyroll fold domain-containing protein [Planctomycetota bacterium]|nr:LamG-like jellyroll fold domain-containing protein [Planctomycetota bacterium]